MVHKYLNVDKMNPNSCSQKTSVIIKNRLCKLIPITVQIVISIYIRRSGMCPSQNSQDRPEGPLWGK